MFERVYYLLANMLGYLKFFERSKLWCTHTKTQMNYLIVWSAYGSMNFSAYLFEIQKEINTVYLDKYF